MHGQKNIVTYPLSSAPVFLLWEHRENCCDLALQWNCTGVP